MMALALIINYVINSPIEKLQAENLFFQKAAQSADELQGEANKLATAGLISQFDVYKKALAAYQGAVADVGKLKRLLSINAKMKDAVTAVARLSSGSEAPFLKITKGVESLLADFTTLGISTSGDPNLTAITIKAYGKEGTEQVRAVAQFHVSNLMIDMRRANDNLSLTASIIKQKDALVAAEIEKIRSRSAILAGALIVAAFVLSLALALRASSDIARAIGGLGSTVAIMATGDLRKRFGMGRGDEIGSLGRNLDGLLDSLSDSMGRIQSVASRNKEMGESLLATVADSTGSAQEIGANTESIRNQMIKVDEMIQADVGDIGDMVREIDLLHDHIRSQAERVTESASAVTQMLASIESISRIAGKDREAAEGLVAEAERSKEVFALSFEKVAEISESVGVIQDMADVIAGVASQTNILAMNAAIEAAHAGEFGKGFAVVADEIAKLATASAESSREIADTIARIVEKVREADSTKQATVEALDGISSRIGEVSESIGEIYGNVSEMQAGGRQVIDAMEHLKSTSADIMTESASIEKRTKSIGSSMDDLGRISHEVASSIGEIANGLRMITGSVQGISEHSERLGALGQDLDEAIGAFKTSGSDGRGA
jgi:methyl-accepting chemotaxis protein